MDTLIQGIIDGFEVFIAVLAGRIKNRHITFPTQNIDIAIPHVQVKIQNKCFFDLLCWPLFLVVYRPPHISHLWGAFLLIAIFALLLI